jgi:broad specificity phosphatase PhoE
MRVIFIRHGQSTGNAGIPCSDLALLELTKLGWRQSREVAESWTKTPDLIVTSPYLRTQQTAAATIERFPDVPVEVWPIHGTPIPQRRTHRRVARNSFESGTF